MHIQVSTEKIENSRYYRVNIYKDDELVAGMLTYDTDRGQAFDRARVLVKMIRGERKYAAYIPIR